MTENSISKQIVKKNNMEMSCWNCFNVENEDKDEQQEDSELELPLSKIRRENRGKFKLYSILASEVSVPKTVPLKQKVRENYVVGKKIEKKLVKESKKKKSVCVQVDEAQIIAIEAANTALPDDEDDLENFKSESTQTDTEENTSHFDGQDSSQNSNSKCNEINKESNVSFESSNIFSKTNSSPIVKQQNVSCESPKIILPKQREEVSGTSKSIRNNKFIMESNKCLNIFSKPKYAPVTKHNMSCLSESKTITLPEQEDSENSTCESTLTDKKDHVPLECLNDPLLDEDQENSQTACKYTQKGKAQNTSLESPSTPSQDRTDSKDVSEIKYNVQIKTSTPKTYIDIKDIKVCEHPSSTSLPEEQKNKEYDIRRIEEMPISERKESVTESEKTDITSSNNSESGYEGSSIRDLNDIDSLNKDMVDAKKNSASSISLVPSPTPFAQAQSSREGFKSSLPVLNLAQRRNILKSSKSLCGDTSDTEHKPVKSLRWSTLELPHRSSRLDDEVYMSDSVSPNHATLPRRSNSPLHHERDMLDRDRFSLNRSGLQVRSESMASVYSGAGEGTRANVTIRGEVQISLLYNYRLGALEVGVKRCRDLASVDVKRNRSDPYVKVYLLPDKSKAGKRKTKVKKNTLSPVFEETLSFVQPLASLSARTLWLSVWHADMFGRNDFLGEVTLPLADVVFDDPAPMWYKLHERTEQFDEQQGSRGDLIIGLKLELSEGARGKGTLHVLVKEAKNLVATKPNGLADVFCKSYLLPERGRLAKQKTGVSRRTLAPRWEHTFTYRGLSLNELGARALELSLWDRDRLASNDFMGGVRLSLGTGTYMGANVNWMDSVGKEVTLWQTMMQRPNFWVEGSLPLRPNLSN